jgi:hypothetical protein
MVNERPRAADVAFTPLPPSRPRAAPSRRVLTPRSRRPPLHARRPHLLLALALALATAGPAACGIAVRRDFSTIPPGQIGFDDMCGLQDYFDSIAAGGASAPTLVSAIDLESAGAKPKRGGSARFAFTSELQLKQLRRVLHENWSRLPDELGAAEAIELEVRWSERAGARRVVTDRDSELFIGRQSWSLPYHVCLSELLYGEPLYRQRRIVWGLPLPGTAAAAP